MGELIAAITDSIFKSRQYRVSPFTFNQPLALWLPALGMAGLLLLPVVYLIIRVLGASPGTWSLVFSATTLGTLARTAWLALAVTMASALIALPLAWLTVRTDLPLRNVWIVLTALPMVIPSYVGAYLMVASLGPRGILAQLLENNLGISSIPPIYGFPGALYVLTVLSYPYILLSVRAALLGLDPALEEAARSLGYNPWKTFLRVTLPQLRPAIAAGSLLVALYVLRDFGAVSIMRYNTFTRVIYIQYKSAFDRPSAAALALMLVGLTLGILALEVWTRGKAQYFHSASGSVRPPTIVPLGRWRWAALAFCAAVVILGLLIPLSVLVYWLLRGLRSGEQLIPLWHAAQGSLLASALGAAVCLAAALPIVVLTVRYTGRGNSLLERLAYAGYALPGIVIALALVFFGVNFALPLYQTLPMLILAYLVLFLPQAVGTVRAALLQVHPSLEEAARSLGRRPWQVFLFITMPLLRPGLLSGGALVFLTTMKELPATLILSPLGFKTLATAVWSAVSEAFFAQAAAPALLLVLASSLPLSFLMFREKR